MRNDCQSLITTSRLLCLWWFEESKKSLKLLQMVKGICKWFNVMSNDCRMIVYIKLSYLSLYLRAGRSFDVKGGSYFEKAESIFKPSIPPNSSSLFRNDPTSFSLAPYKFYILWMWLPPPSPEYSSYKSCWGSLCSNFLNKMMTAKSCCFIQDKNTGINNKTAKRKATWGFPLFGKSCVRLVFPVYGLLRSILIHACYTLH